MCYNIPVKRRRSAAALAALLGILIGLAVWGALLGGEVRRHEPGLWTLRFRRVIACGLDYNGPPWSARVTVWLSCSESDSWQLWPPGH